MNQSDHQGDNEWIYEYRIEMGIGILVISELFTNYDNNRAVSLRKIKLSKTFLPVWHIHLEGINIDP